MKFEDIRSEVIEKAFVDYSCNCATATEIESLKEGVYRMMHINLDEEYVSFLQILNGFELNGLNFYGTERREDIYILSIIDQNIFWKGEIPKLKNYLLIADGDMDFYCYDIDNRKYKVLSKVTLEEMGSHSQFIDLMSNLINTYR